MLPGFASIESTKPASSGEVAKRLLSARAVASPFGSGSPGGSDKDSLRLGRRYEALVHERVEPLVRERALYRRGPWFEYQFAGERLRFCQPDAVMETPECIVVVEVKLRHHEGAWRKLRNVYQPVIQRLFPKLPVNVLEVTSAYDPHVSIPEPVVLLDDVCAAFSPRNDFMVLPWKL